MTPATDGPDIDPRTAAAAIAGASLARVLGNQSSVVDGFLVTAETLAFIVRQLFAMSPKGSWIGCNHEVSAMQRDAAMNRQRSQRGSPHLYTQCCGIGHQLVS